MYVCVCVCFFYFLKERMKAINLKCHSTQLKAFVTGADSFLCLRCSGLSVKSNAFPGCLSCSIH
jgi:hypothetical protein